MLSVISAPNITSLFQIRREPVRSLSIVRISSLNESVQLSFFVFFYLMLSPTPACRRIWILSTVGKWEQRFAWPWFKRQAIGARQVAFSLRQAFAINERIDVKVFGGKLDASDCVCEKCCAIINIKLERLFILTRWVVVIFLKMFCNTICTLSNGECCGFPSVVERLNLF